MQTLLRLSKPYFKIYVALDTKVLSDIYFDYALLAIIFACVVPLFITFLSVLVPLMVVHTCNL